MSKRKSPELTRHRNATAPLIEQLMALRKEMVAATAAPNERLQALHPEFAESGRNLLHYLALRRHDLRALQLQLAARGLSSLGRAESHVLATVDAVLDVLIRLDGGSAPPNLDATCGIDFERGEELLAEHTRALLGPSTPGRDVRIMVTMPSEAAQDYALVHALVREGMNCMRINCAHDGPPVWARMIAHLRRAEEAFGCHCRVVMDLAGPKLRTGPVEAEPAILHLRPRRDARGRVTAPARIWLTPVDAPTDPPTPADGVLPVAAAWLRRLTAGDVIELRDARDARRSMVVADSDPSGCWALLEKSSYIESGVSLRRIGDDRAGDDRTTVGPLPASPGAIDLRIGDRLLVTRDQSPGTNATTDGAGGILSPARVGCTIPEVFDDVRSGEAIWFDDGKIGGVVEDVDAHRAVVHVTHAQRSGARLRADRGINLPDSQLSLPALTPADLDALTFVAQHADVVELSFANSVRDVETLQHHLAASGSAPPSIVLKIETRRGFEQLPDMLLAAMRGGCCGVMIARGDLAVECGFERLAEVQEEILWISEAAHVPVIWATQVLESLAKDGMPSRAEITDAAMGHRAECVMLNKGPYVLQAVRTLDDILRRMQAHNVKKRSMLRELRLAHSRGTG